MHWMYLAIAIVAEVVGTSFLKASGGFTKLGPSLMVLAGYGTAFLFLSLTLERIPVVVGFAIWSGAGVTLIALIGWREARPAGGARAVADRGGRGGAQPVLEDRRPLTRRRPPSNPGTAGLDSDHSRCRGASVIKADDRHPIPRTHLPLRRDIHDTRAPTNPE